MMKKPIHPHVPIIHEYLAGRLSAEAAAREMIAIEGPPLNMSFGPELRPLLAELHKLRTGQEPPSEPPYVPDPHRHAGGGLDLLTNHASSTWTHISKPPLENRELRLHCRIDAETEAAARRIAAWFSERRSFQIDVTSPADAGSDDWEISVITPARHWDLASLREWEGTLRRAPLNSDASFGSLGVSKP